MQFPRNPAFWAVSAFWAFGMLGITVISGVQHDYVAYTEIWTLIVSGGDPWSTNNVYGPFFNLFAFPAALHPLVPKLVFALSFILVTIALAGLLVQRMSRKWTSSLIVFGLLLPANYLVIGIVFVYGLNDGLVAALVGAAVVARLARRNVLVGVLLGVAVLLKFYPLLLIPFFSLDRRSADVRILVSAGITCSLGMLMSFFVWGTGIFSAWSWIGSRDPGMLAWQAGLRRSPLVSLPDSFLGFMDSSSVVLMGIVLAAALAASWWLRMSWVEGAAFGLLASLLVYKGGHPQQYLPWLVLVGGILVMSSSRARQFALVSLPLALFLGAFQWGFHYRTQDHFALIGILPVDSSYAAALLVMGTIAGYLLIASLNLSSLLPQVSGEPLTQRVTD